MTAPRPRAPRGRGASAQALMLSPERTAEPPMRPRDAATLRAPLGAASNCSAVYGSFPESCRPVDDVRRPRPTGSSSRRRIDAMSFAPAVTRFEANVGLLSGAALVATSWPYLVRETADSHRCRDVEGCFPACVTQAPTICSTACVDPDPSRPQSAPPRGLDRWQAESPRPAFPTTCGKLRRDCFGHCFSPV